MLGHIENAWGRYSGMRCRVGIEVRALGNCTFLIIARIRSNRPILFLTEKRFPGFSSLGKAAADMPRIREAFSDWIPTAGTQQSDAEFHLPKNPKN